MNIIIKYLTVIPTFIKYLRGSVLLYDGKYDAALKKFEACKKHPSFQNELFFSYYGQTLCGLGRLQEGHRYLLKACEKYEEEKWSFENDYSKNLAVNTLNALKHVMLHTGAVEGKEYLDKKPKLK